MTVQHPPLPHLPQIPVYSTEDAKGGGASLFVVFFVLGVGALGLSVFLTVVEAARDEGDPLWAVGIGGLVTALLAGFVAWVGRGYRRFARAKRAIEERYRREGRQTNARIVHKAVEERGGYDDAPDLILYLQFDPSFLLRAPLEGRTQRYHDRELGEEVPVEYLASNPRVCRVT